MNRRIQLCKRRAKGSDSVVRQAEPLAFFFSEQCRKMTSSIVVLVAISTFALGANDAADNNQCPQGKSPASLKQPAKPEATPVKPEKPKEVRGRVVLDSREVHYIAHTGTIPVFKDDGTPQANVFYVYYAAARPDGKRLSAENSGGRPIAFCFNGGPGSSSVWLHLGGLGPRRLDLPPDGLTPVTVSKVVDNPNSILDATDLVFVDTVSTGLSLPVKGEKADQFYGVNEDIRAAGEFVRLFTTREQRWGSPKYLIGESYGGMRIAGLVHYLQDTHGFYPEGLVFVSGLLNLQTLGAENGNDLPYVLYLPTLTATAFYHKKLPPDLQVDLGKAVAESRAYAQGDYTLALMRGSELPEGEHRAVAEKLSRLTGIPVERIEDQNLRINPSVFRKMLLRSERKTLGYYDARVTGDDDNYSSPYSNIDPSLSNVLGGFSSAVNAYIRGELGYESDYPYHVLSNLPWKWSDFAGRFVSLESRLLDAMTTNPKLRLLVLTGRRDFAVPADSMPFSISHMQLPKRLRANIRFEQFESGHMMYLFQPDAQKLRVSLVEFVNAERAH